MSNLSSLDNGSVNVVYFNAEGDPVDRTVENVGSNFSFKTLHQLTKHHAERLRNHWAGATSVVISDRYTLEVYCTLEREAQPQVEQQPREPEPKPVYEVQTCSKRDGWVKVYEGTEERFVLDAYNAYAEAKVPTRVYHDGQLQRAYDPPSPQPEQQPQEEDFLSHRHADALAILDPAIVKKARRANVYLELDQDADGDQVYTFRYQGRLRFCYSADQLEEQLDGILDGGGFRRREARHDEADDR